MSICNVEVIKHVGKYLNAPVGPVCYNTARVLTTVLDKENVEGFATIVLRLASKSGLKLNADQNLLSYQWLEHIAMFADQAASNPTVARSFLQDINKALERNTFLTGQFITVTDVAAYHVLYPLLERLSVVEREALLNICRWSKHIQVQPRLSETGTKATIFAPLPRQIMPHELVTVDPKLPVIFHPQPFSFPKYPVIVYFK